MPETHFKKLGQGQQKIWKFRKCSWNTYFEYSTCNMLHFNNLSCTAYHHNTIHFYFLISDQFQAFKSFSCGLNSTFSLILSYLNIYKLSQLLELEEETDPRTRPIKKHIVDFTGSESPVKAFKEENIHNNYQVSTLLS